VQWKSKKQAAEFLGSSTRAIERAVRRGHLAAQYRPSKHGPMAWFAPQELARYRNFQQSRVPVGFNPAPEPKRDSGFAVGTITTLQDAEAPSSQRKQRSNTVPLNQRLLLSLADAASLSGLPRSFLVESTQTGRLKSVKIGRTTLVKRSDLERFVAEL
jgi:excisionase family DNA binding protein